MGSSVGRMLKEVPPTWTWGWIFIFLLRVWDGLTSSSSLNRIKLGRTGLNGNPLCSVIMMMMLLNHSVIVYITIFVPSVAHFSISGHHPSRLHGRTSLNSWIVHQKKKKVLFIPLTLSFRWWKMDQFTVTWSKEADDPSRDIIFVDAVCETSKKKFQKSSKKFRWSTPCLSKKIYYQKLFRYTDNFYWCSNWIINPGMEWINNRSIDFQPSGIVRVRVDTSYASEDSRRNSGFTQRKPYGGEESHREMTKNLNFKFYIIQNFICCAKARFTCSTSSSCSRIKKRALGENV